MTTVTVEVRETGLGCFLHAETQNVEPASVGDTIADLFAAAHPEMDARVLVDGALRGYRNPAMRAGGVLMHPLPQGAGFVEMVYVPAGTFLRGCDTSSWADEQPEARVEITRGFFVAKYPTRLREFRAFVDATGHVTTAEVEGDERTWQSPGFEQGDDHPVVCVLRWRFARGLAFACRPKRSGSTPHAEPTAAPTRGETRRQTIRDSRGRAISVAEARHPSVSILRAPHRSASTTSRETSGSGLRTGTTRTATDPKRSIQQARSKERAARFVVAAGGSTTLTTCARRTAAGSFPTSVATASGFVRLVGKCRIPHTLFPYLAPVRVSTRAGNGPVDK